MQPDAAVELCKQGEVRSGERSCAVLAAAAQWQRAAQWDVAQVLVAAIAAQPVSRQPEARAVPPARVVQPRPEVAQVLGEAQSREAREVARAQRAASRPRAAQPRGAQERPVPEALPEVGAAQV